MKLEFEADYRSKILEMKFSESSIIRSREDLQPWKDQWTKALMSWHSPYKALIDCTNLSISPLNASLEEQIKKSFETFITFFKGFYLRKVVGFGLDKTKGHNLLPFKVYNLLEDAQSELNIRKDKLSQQSNDFRSSILFDNHFRQHTIEVSFSQQCHITEIEQLTVFKSKLLNNLMQWHSSWNLLIDCSALEVDPKTHKEFESMFKSLKGFFLKKVVGYSPKADKTMYPFVVYKARHRAAAELDSEGNFSGESANCASRKG